MTVIRGEGIERTDIVTAFQHISFTHSDAEKLASETPVIRMLPVFLVLIGSGIKTEGKLFIGWFGPRGLASIVFAVIVLDSKLPNADLVAMTVTCTIILSIVAHGITANPLVAAFAAKTRSSK